jgi:glycosyltransferase involved in cell wall biosynthesis
MSEAPILLQVCANDHPPFVDICRYYEAAARSLGWTPVTVMLATRLAAPVEEFHYLPGNGAAADSWGRAPGTRLRAVLDGLLDGRPPVLTLCHRYRAYRAFMASGTSAGRLVVVAHEFDMLGWRRRIRRRLDALLWRPRPTFAGVSQPVAEDLNQGVGAVALLPNGIDLARTDRVRLGREEARSALGLPQGPFIVGVVGRLHPKKRPELAIAGLRAALDRLPEAMLVFVGDGALQADLERQAAGLPVCFKGFVPDAVNLVAAFDLLLLPSGEREAFGLVALEAMAAGVPVLCGPAPGPRFVVGATGRRFAPDTAAAVGDALVKACRERDGALVDLARQARTRVEQVFSVAAGAARLQALAAGRLPAAIDTGSGGLPGAA